MEKENSLHLVNFIRSPVKKHLLDNLIVPPNASEDHQNDLFDYST